MTSYNVYVYVGCALSLVSPSESQKVLNQPGKKYYKLKVFTGCRRQSADFTDEPFIKFVVGISSYKQFCALSDNIGC